MHTTVIAACEHVAVAHDDAPRPSMELVVDGGPARIGSFEEAAAAAGLEAGGE